MAFSRRKDRERRGGRDPFGHLHDERAQVESEDPWFLAPDEGPELDVQAGISSNLSEVGLSSRPGEPPRVSEDDPEEK
jgi:hypothetical protein